MEAGEELVRAVEAAREAEEIINHYYGRSPEVRLKDDETPVTVADVEAEKAIREILEQAFPDHGFYGEESGLSDRGAESLWIVDPIDGTKSFIRGSPFFSTQIALLRGGELVLGVSNAPVFAELAAAEKGRGASINGERVQVSGIDDLAGVGRLVRSVDRTRGYGDFFHYHQLAAGRLDVVLESDVAIYDVAALAVVVREAGGRATALDGGPITLEGTTILATNGRLHEAVLARLSGGSDAPRAGRS